VDRLLAFKARLVGTPLEDVAKHIRRAIGFRHRLKHPEMWEIFLEDSLFPTVLAKLLTDKSNVVDVGCHIGSFISAASRIAPNGCHILIEPTPAKCELLRVKFPKATLHQVAVSDTNGIATFEENLTHSGLSRLQGSSAADGSTSCYPVKVAKLDDLLLEKVDLLKMDIEGNELAALRGAVGIITRDQPPIIFECGSEYSLDAIGASRKDLFEFITNELGYSIYTFTDFLYDKGSMSFSEFKKCGLYPFRAFNFVALPGKM